MQLTIFNGSPRAKKSNTDVLMEQFVAGFTAGGGSVQGRAYLLDVKEVERHVELFARSECAIIAFPLYVDSVPGIMKHFIEALAGQCGRPNNPQLGFIVQSGFPEANHSRFVERYLEKLARRLGSPYLGTVIKGAVEGIQIQHPRMTKKLFKRFHDLGRRFAQTGRFDESIMKQLAKPEQLSASTCFVIRIMDKIGMTKMYWNMQLKKNDAYENRFARPFA